MQRTLPIPRRMQTDSRRGIVSPGTRTGLAMASIGAILAMATVWLEEEHHLDFAVGLTIGIALLPWIMSFMPSTAKMLPQPAAICALVLGSGVLVAMAGLYSGRAYPLAIGALLAITALVVWIGASYRPHLRSRR